MFEQDANPSLGLTVVNTTPPATVASLVAAIVAGCHGQTRRIYDSHLRKFITEGNGRLTRQGIQEYAGMLRAKGLGASSVNQALSAIKRLAEEAMERGILGREEWIAIRTIRTMKTRTMRQGNWLSREQVTALFSSCTTPRDLALLGVMVGCGLRREEISELNWEHFQMREGRAVLADFVGKGGKVRTVAVPGRVAEWLGAVRPNVYTFKNSPIFKSEGGGRLSPSGVWWIVKGYGDRLGVPIRPHDLRRTFGRLARDGGATLEQIQFTLGHESLRTTERYLGGGLNLKPGMAAGDQIGL
jgi:integrase